MMEPAQAQLVAMKHNPWREAVIDALVESWIYNESHVDNPTKAVADLLAWEVQMASDPVISTAAQALIERGRQEASPEVCICAAVRAEDGTIWRGHRHHDAMAAAWRSIPVWRQKPRFPAHSQGFVTSRNRFVDRLEGRRLQDAAGIASVAPGGYRGDLLCSEDLY